MTGNITGEPKFQRYTTIFYWFLELPMQFTDSFLARCFGNQRGLYANTENKLFTLLDYLWTHLHFSVLSETSKWSLLLFHRSTSRVHWVHPDQSTRCSPPGPAAGSWSTLKEDFRSQKAFSLFFIIGILPPDSQSKTGQLICVNLTANNTIFSLIFCSLTSIGINWSEIY